LCYLAAGKIDVYFESFIQPWDVAAGACILKEAGGKISDYAGGDDKWENGHQVIATNGLLHESMLKEIQKAML
jgi:myo-inositol-1(or 4)-monophosphatase